MIFFVQRNTLKHLVFLFMYLFSSSEAKLVIKQRQTINQSRNLVKQKRRQIDKKKTKHMLLKLWGFFCILAVVHTSYFDCVMKATAPKVKVANMFAMLIIWCKIQKRKIIANNNFLYKMNPIKSL